MAAILRVKRCLDEEPLEVLILNCKRRKVSNSSEKNELSATILKFAGTVEKDENVFTHIKKQNVSNLEQLKDHYKKHKLSSSDKLRTQHEQHSKSNRYRIVNCFRSGSLDSGEPNQIIDDTVDKDVYTVFDIEYNSEETDQVINKSYVYDLYYTNSDDFGDAQVDDYVSIHPWNDSLIFGSARDNGYNGADSDDSEDSNAENNWRNEYPDESDMESIGGDDMLEAINRVDLGNDLSSDDEEDDFVYCIENEYLPREETDEDDVNRYGEPYARFKAANKKFVESTGLDYDFYYGDIDENEYYY